MNLDEIIQALDGLPEKERLALEKEAFAATDDMRWVPNPGPQTQAYYCEADELFYGGQAGGGKSDLIIGLALTGHERSLILREYRDDAKDLAERMLDLLGGRNGWNGQDLLYRTPDRLIRFGGCRSDDEKQRFKGKPHSLIGFDEVSDFPESVYTFIIAWNRSAKPGQRCRVVAAGNPPTRPEGLWVIRRWAAWLDPNHPNPAKPGELRWYTTIDGADTEVDGPGPHVIPGEVRPVMARSRTFIPSTLADNPDLAGTNYGASLDALPQEMRDAYRDGRFDVGLKDGAFQVIPTAWVRAAQSRWTANPPAGVPMCAIGVDASGGGADPMTLAPRYDGWFAPVVEVPGKDLPMDRIGAYSGGLVIANRKDQADIVIDMSGGYGSAMYEHLRSNHLEPIAYKGGTSATGRDRSRQFSFQNKRSQSIWRFREALDPEQPGGSTIMLPPDPALVADLTAPTYEVKSAKICVESKEEVCKRLGRSTDHGDAVVMAWSVGYKGENIKGGFQSQRGQTPRVLLNRPESRRKR